MPTEWIVYACLGLGVSSALVAGVFQSFSDFVMRSLAAARPAGGAEVMQNINREVFRSVFLATMLGLAPMVLALAGYAVLTWQGIGSTFIIVGGLVYFTAVFLVTMFGNVPMNNHLDRLDPDTKEAAHYWSRYLKRWTQWNHVRTFGSAFAALSFLLASLTLA